MKKQSKVNSVIVGVDFSNYSKIVVKQARVIATGLRVPLVFAHVFDVPMVGIEGPSLAGPQLSLLIEQLRVHLEKRVQAFYNVSGAETIIAKYGNAHEQVAEIAKSYKHPIIVIGYRGDRNIVSRLFLGSTAEKLAVHSRFPVWIHRGQKTLLPKKILVPCDLSERSTVVINGLRMLGWSGIESELYHVRPPMLPILDYQAWKALNAQIQKANALQVKKFRQKHSQKKVIESEGDVLEEIMKRSKTFDVIAISPRKKRGLLSSFGSVTSKVVRSGKTSVLVIP